MKFICYFGLFLLFFNNINCSSNSNVTGENLPWSYQTSQWRSIFQKIEEKKIFLPFFYHSTDQSNESKNDELKCLACNAVVTAVLTEREEFDMSEIQLAAQLQYFCVFLGIEDDRVCEGVMDLHVELVLYILDNKHSLNSQQICSLMLDCKVGSEAFEWTIDLPKGTTVEKVESTGTDSFKIAQISDIHYDPRYTAGKELHCNEPTCCQDDQNEATGNSTPCGYWSSYSKADTPLRLISATLDRMAEEELEWVYFTGDLVAHRIWETSHAFNTKSISDVMDLFADKLKMKVYPILGNHETHPVNLYAPSNVSENLNSQWLFDTVFKKWSTWLGEDVKETVEKGGYYTVTPKKGFRIIVLNNNVCHPENWWNLYDDYDPYGQLEWLVQTLKKAEDAKEIVHILLHIPNRSCATSWGREYNRIIERFSNTIAAQFNGHTHRDHFHIFYDSNNKSNNVVFNGASVMPDQANPCFKVYTVDSEGFDVMDTELYTFDLEKANADKNHKIDWLKLYSFKEAFGVKKMVASELDTLVNTMVSDIKNKNTTLIDKYYNYYYRNSDKAKEECGTDCQKNYLCEIVTTVRGKTSKCDGFNL